VDSLVKERGEDNGAKEDEHRQHERGYPEVMRGQWRRCCQIWPANSRQRGAAPMACRPRLIVFGSTIGTLARGGLAAYASPIRKKARQENGAKEHQHGDGEE